MAHRPRNFQNPINNFPKKFFKIFLKFFVKNFLYFSYERVGCFPYSPQPKRARKAIHVESLLKPDY